MKRVLLIGIFSVVGLLSPRAGSAQDWASLTEALRNIRSIKAEFLQQRTLPILTKPLLSEGRFFFQASGSLRWEYLRPLRSVMIQKGNTLEYYHFSDGIWKPEVTQAVETRRMVITEISRWFQGRFDQSTVFQPLYSPGPPGRVILTPREGVDQFIRRITIFLSNRIGVIDRVEIEEPGGSRTSIEFKKIEINSSLSSEIFEKP